MLLVTLVSAADWPSPETRSVQGSGKPHSKSQMAQGQIAFPEKPPVLNSGFHWEEQSQKPGAHQP